MPINFWIFVLLTLALVIFISYGTYATAQLLRHWQPDRNLLLLPAENLIRLLLITLKTKLKTRCRSSSPII